MAVFATKALQRTRAISVSEKASELGESKAPQEPTVGWSKKMVHTPTVNKSACFPEGIYWNRIPIPLKRQPGVSSSDAIPFLNHLG